MRKQYLLLLFCCLTAFAQPPSPDSLLTVLKKQKPSAGRCETLNAISDFYFHIDPQAGIRYANEALKLSKSLGLKDQQGKALLNRGRHEMIMGNYEASLASLKTSEDIYKGLKDDCSLGLVHLERSTVFGNLSKYPDALDACFESLRLFEKCGKTEENKPFVSSCYQNIANIYNATESFEKALEYYEKARREWSGVPNEGVNVAMNHASKGIVYEKQAKYDEALKVYLEAIAQLKPLKADVPLAYVNCWIGETYLSVKQYDKSIESSEKAYKTILNIGDRDLIASIVQNIGAALLGKGIDSGDNALAKSGYDKLLEALALHKELGNHEGIISDYASIARYHRFVDDHAKAVDALELWATYKDSVFNFKNKQSLQNLEDERTIELRNKELEISKLTIDNKEKQTWYLIAAMSLLAIIGLLLFYQSRSRRKTNKKLEALNAELQEADRVKTRFFSILNHDLRAPVARLVSFLRLQRESPELLDEESRSRMESHTINSAENLLESMEDMLLWTKGQMEHFSPKPRLVKVSEVFAEMRQYFAGTAVALEFDDANAVLETDPDYLKTILRNLTANAIKALEHTPEPVVSWKAFSTNGRTELTVTDNGPGGTQEKFRALYDEKEVVGIKTGLGLHLIRDLAKAIGCRITVESKPGTGTTFTLNFGQ